VGRRLSRWSGVLGLSKKRRDRQSPIADFYIGAHATVAGFMLLTRDEKRYRTYFPRLRIASP